MRRPLLVLVILAIGLVSPAAAGAVAPLTPAQYAAIDGAFDRLVKIDINDPGSGLTDTAKRECRRLDSGDLLLRRFRQTCTVKVRLKLAFGYFDGCTGPKNCARRARLVRKRVNELVPRLRALNGVLRQLVSSPCRSALRASKADLDLLERTGAFMRLLERAVKTQSPRLFQRLRRRATTLDRLTATAPSTSSQHKRVRSACNPAPRA